LQFQFDERMLLDSLRVSEGPSEGDEEGVEGEGDDWQRLLEDKEGSEAEPLTPFSLGIGPELADESFRNLSDLLFIRSPGTAERPRSGPGPVGEAEGIVEESVEEGMGRGEAEGSTLGVASRLAEARFGDGDLPPEEVDHT
jgi:hypothetical protein